MALGYSLMPHGSRPQGYSLMALGLRATASRLMALSYSLKAHGSELQPHGSELQPHGSGHLGLMALDTSASWLWTLVPRFHDLILSYCTKYTLFLSTRSHLDRYPRYPPCSMVPSRGM